MRDVIVVGGGLAGLSAAWECRDLDVVVLEADARVGGRIKSERRGDYWLNTGGHVFSGPGSQTQQLADEVGVEIRPIKGHLAGLSMNGALITRGSVEFYPLRIPMGWRDRLRLLTSGIKVRLAVLQYARLATRRAGETYWQLQDRIYNYRNDRTFADFVGEASGDAMALFAATVTRSGGRVDEVAAGTGIGYFKIVWDRSPSLGNSIWGGASSFPEAIAGRLGGRVRTSASVTRVVIHDDRVEVTYSTADGEHTEQARHVVMAPLAEVTHEVLQGAPVDLMEALGKIRYAPYVAASFLTNEKRAVWDGSYGIATPKRSFTILTNQTSVVRTDEQATGRPRGPGSSIFVFTATDWAHTLLGMSDDEIRETYLRDLDEIFPRFSDSVVETQIQRWPKGQTFNFPGRAKLQPIFTRDHGRLHLAGDFMGTMYTETAITTGRLAGQSVVAKLTAEAGSKTASNQPGGEL